jgi:hypothetical protein
MSGYGEQVLKVDLVRGLISSTIFREWEPTRPVRNEMRLRAAWEMG